MLTRRHLLPRRQPSPASRETRGAQAETRRERRDATTSRHLLIVAASFGNRSRGETRRKMSENCKTVSILIVASSKFLAETRHRDMFKRRVEIVSFGRHN